MRSVVCETKIASCNKHVPARARVWAQRSESNRRDEESLDSFVDAFDSEAMNGRLDGVLGVCLMVPLSYNTERIAYIAHV